MIITHNIKMDLTLRKIHVLDFVQGSSTTPLVQIQLFSQNQYWDIPDGAGVLIRYRKPNLKAGVYDTLPDNSPAWNISGNCVTIAIAPDVLSLPGECFLVVSLVLGDQEISSFKLTLRIQANPALGAPVEGEPVSISGMLPAPEVSKNGQFIAVEEVNDRGKVIKTKAVDLPGYGASPNEIIQIVDTYLAQNPPPAGPQGPKGEKGDPGIHVGPEEPVDENIVVWIDPESEGTSVLVEAPGTANVGQTIAVKTVDENGVPVEWQAADLPDSYTKAQIDAIMGAYINDIDALIGGDS